MDMQKIEPLLMDYALGGTSPEVSALIEALEEKDAGVRTEVDHWRSITALARQTAPVETAASVPLFPARWLERAGRVARYRQAAVWCAALGACLMLGYVIGNAQGDRGQSATLTGKPVAIATSSNVSTVAVDGFWSPARLIAIQRESQRSQAQSSWNSFNKLSILFHPSGG